MTFNSVYPKSGLHWIELFTIETTCLSSLKKGNKVCPKLSSSLSLNADKKQRKFILNKSASTNLQQKHFVPHWQLDLKQTKESPFSVKGESPTDRILPGVIFIQL